MSKPKNTKSAVPQPKAPEAAPAAATLPEPSPATESAPQPAPAPAAPPVVAVEVGTPESLPLQVWPPPLDLTDLSEAERAIALAAMEQYELGVLAGVAGDPVPEDATPNFKLGHSMVDPATKLRLDGPTPEAFEAAGGKPGDYPPKGYAPVTAIPPEELLKQQAAQAVIDYNAGVELALKGQPLPEGASQAVADGFAAVDPETKLRLDGPTVAEFMAAGYPEAAYPPKGYARKQPKPADRKPVDGPTDMFGNAISYRPLFGGVTPASGGIFTLGNGK